MDNTNRSRNILMAILAVVTIACIIFGAWWNLGRHDGFFKIGVSLGEKVSDTIDVSEFSGIDIDVRVGDVVIEEGTKASVEYSYPEKLVPTVEVKNGKLYIKNEKKIKVNFANNINGKLTITVPKGTKLDHADDNNLTVNLGNMRISDLTFGNLSVEANMGNIRLEGVKAEAASLDADMGNIDVKDCTFSKVTADANMGNIEVKDTFFLDGKMEADMGNIEASGNYKRLSADCNMGNIKVECPEDTKLELEVDMGDIKVNGNKQKSRYTN